MRILRRRLLSLHPSTQNEKYAEAIARAVAAGGDDVHVLDIGTGTGLLALVCIAAFLFPLRGNSS